MTHLGSNFIFNNSIFRVITIITVITIIKL